MTVALVEPEERKPTWQRDEKDPELWLHVPSGVWYVRKKRKGKKPLFKTTGQKTKGRARTVANAILNEWLGLSAKQFEANGVLFRDYAPQALADWLASSKYRPRTKKNLEELVAVLVREIGYARLVDINEGFLETWVEDFRRRSTRTTFRDFVATATKVLRHAKRNGVIASVPEFENPDPKKETGRAYTRAEMQAILGVAEGALERARAGKNRQTVLRRLNMLAQLRACFNAFMRKREALCAPWSEIDLETGRWVIPPERVKMGSKTGKGKDIFVPESLLALLREIRAQQAPEVRWVFPSPFDPSRPTWDNKKAWEALKRAAGVEGKARWHDLRHTALSWALLGDDEFQARLEMMTPEEQERARAQLANPLLVAKYAGTNIRTIEGTYLKVKAEHTRGVAEAIRL